MALFGRETAEDEARALAYRDWMRRRNPFALASLVLGIFSLIEAGVLIVFGVAGIVLGIVALLQLRRTHAEIQNQPVAAPKVAVLDLAYADAGLPEPVDGSKYEDHDPPVPKTHGHRLAWTGIGLSALSLVLAALLYLRVFG